MQREPWGKNSYSHYNLLPTKTANSSEYHRPKLLFYQTCPFGFSRVVLGIKPWVATTSQILGESLSLPSTPQTSQILVNLSISPPPTVGYTLYYIPLFNVEYILQYISLSLHRYDVPFTEPARL